ncbi:hypothetical protein [Candidatus Nitrotoga sp. M5]|uniref:hypothetical protein n=1 Tax=Candidatus Nitrotoga sp. M5 TaxID=2890409 RepID=UPI001EF6EF73|nr:hypothetical protein [Candidatus Nitrotoga sp. M5]CAH1387931.1 hypothetical protein NTGM5_750003 [Candidatus Nitrotoga sp. M5]
MKSIRKLLILLGEIFPLMRISADFTLLTAVFIKNSLLTSCSNETHPTIRRTETGGQIGPEESLSDGPETMPRKGLAAKYRPVTGGYGAKRKQRRIIRGGWRCCPTNATSSLYVAKWHNGAPTMPHEVAATRPVRHFFEA